MWRWPQRRLEAEAIRDAVLVATGELDRAIGGISVPPEREENRPRRTIYLFQKRSDMPAVMNMFDGPDVIASCAHRAVSTVPLQPLYLLNSQFMANRAAALAQTVIAQAGDDTERQIRVAFRRTLGREPDQVEAKFARQMLQSNEDETCAADDASHARLTRFCHALLNLNEFVYIP